MLSSILVNLTRMVGLFSFLGTLIFDITNFINIKSRIISMLSGLNLTETYENKVLIKGLKPIYVNNKIIDDLNYFFDEILKLNNGRFTITGDNGAGKTTLLLSLLRNERDKVIFIPSDPGTIEWNIDITNKSTGSKIFSILYSEIDNSNEKVILLDEWDANLDTENKSKIDKLIDKISEKKVVIEVRHL
ncbi:ATP-binding cassette domain-containing protein [Acinetobacter guillouiae]|uniref:ATP-binding cassette domain-containing protein n=1 Tax=Acinetobacter guillouiae TaxID=106649 RepID=UPI001CD50528|nr:ABC transporter ATP-binding protein [Acinetobacter guillouiae]